MNADWTGALRPADLALLDEVRHKLRWSAISIWLGVCGRHTFRKCDGYKIFSDRMPHGKELVKLVNLLDMLTAAESAK